MTYYEGKRHSLGRMWSNTKALKEENIKLEYNLTRTTVEYRQGALNFVNVAKTNLRNVEKILCPYMNCRNLRRHDWQKQLPHTTGRRGMARFIDDLKKQSQDSSSISRADVWVKSHTKKNGYKKMC